MQVLIELTGTTGLVQHNVQLADPDCEWTRLIAEYSSKRKKTDADRKEIARLEFLGGLYHDAEIGIYVPTWNVIKCFERAATLTRQGTTLLRALAVHTDKVALHYPGRPKDPDALWADKTHHFRRQVVVKRDTVTRMRPVFPQWRIDFECELEEELMNPQDLREISIKGGRMEGLGDARRMGQGRFHAEVQYEGAEGPASDKIGAEAQPVAA